MNSAVFSVSNFIYSNLIGEPERFSTIKVKPQILDKLKYLVECGQLRPVVDKCFSLDEARSAFKRVASGRNSGKVVVTIREREISLWNLNPSKKSN